MAQTPLSSLEYHVLVALVERPLHGYAVLRAVDEESGGSVAPRAGSLYRVLARLMSRGLVAEAEPRGADAIPHPGLDRKYYSLTAVGRQVVRSEAQRLRRAADLADRRLKPADGTD